MTLQPWLTTYDPLAVCNDGSPAGYYYLPGSDPTLTLLYLEGGYWCWDGPSCTERYQTLKFDMSSSGWGTSFAQTGLFSTVAAQNPWANANLVFVKYCSSDSWFGDAGASSSTFGFSFRGARIVAATMTALQAHNGLGASGGPERLLFAGCSAGGRGVLSNLDAVAASAPANVQVQGLLDAAAWVDVQPIIPNMLTLQQMTQDLFAFTTPPVPADCAAQYTGADAWMCVWPSYRLPFITTNYFLNAAQFDAFQIMYDTNNLDDTYCCTTPQEQQYVEQFQTATLALFAQLPSWVTIYSSACFVHCLSSNADFYEFTVNGISLMEAMTKWYFDDAPENVIESCTGWACTLQCSGGPWQPSNTPCASTTNVCANTYMYTTPPSPSGQATALPSPPPPTSPAAVVPVAVAAQPAPAAAAVVAAAPVAAAAVSGPAAAAAVALPVLTPQQQAQAQLQAQQLQLQQQQQQAAMQAQEQAQLQQTQAQAQANAALAAAQAAVLDSPPGAVAPAAAVAAATARIIALAPVGAAGPAPGPTSLPVEIITAPAKRDSRTTLIDGAMLALLVSLPVGGALAYRMLNRKVQRINGRQANESSSLL